MTTKTYKAPTPRDADGSIDMLKVWEGVHDALLSEYNLTEYVWWDGLSQEEMGALATGHLSNVETLRENYYDLAADVRWETACNIADEVLGDVFYVDGDLEDLWSYSDQRQSIIDTIFERDCGDPFGEAVRQTWRKARMRVRIGDMAGRDLEMGDNEWVDRVMGTLPDSLTPEDRGVVEDALLECGERVVPFLLGELDADTLYNLGDAGKVRVTGCHILLYDIYGGSGMDFALTNPVTVEVRRDFLTTDGDAEGYSWDKCAGPIWSCYDSLTIERVN